MQITLDITPEAQAELTRQAVLSGSDPQSYAANLLEDALHIPAINPIATEVEEVAFGKRLVEVCAMIRGMTDDVDFSRAPSTWRPLDIS